MDGCPLGLGLVVEDKPTEFSCNYGLWLIAYTSRPLMKIETEQLYTEIEKEALVETCVCERFQNYLLGTYFNIN